jgi:hypothetical protein
MSSNKPAEWIIEAIRCSVTGKSCSISYELCTDNNTMLKTSIDEQYIGFKFFESKQELMANLFADCLTEGLVVK